MLKKLLLIGLLIIAIIGLPLSVYFFQQEQDPRSHASEGTTISLIPVPGPGKSSEKIVGDPVDLNVILDPVDTTIVLLSMQIKYDPTKLELIEPKYSPHQSADEYEQSLPKIVSQPKENNGTVSVTVTSGIDTTRAISNPGTSVGTFHFRAIDKTPDEQPTVVTFTELTKATSLQTAVSSFSAKNSAEISIKEALPSPTPSPSPTPTSTPAPSTPEPDDTTAVKITTYLHGIGYTGDSANPTATTSSNQNPRMQQRSFSLSFYNASNQLVASKTDLFDFDTRQGHFSGTTTTDNNLPEGNYIIKIKTDSFLTKKIPGFFFLTPGTPVTLPPITLIAGDINGDNAINVLDLNILISCYNDFEEEQPKPNCQDGYKTLADLNDDGKVNQTDYSLFIREMSVQKGE